MNKQKEIIAVLDPMCSWCWGFEPVLDALREDFSDEVKFSLILGGLRTKGDQAWDDDFKEHLRQHWQSVQAKTDQSFNPGLLQMKDFVYDTEPSCRAVITVRELDETKQFSFFKALQEAFYLRAEDITRTDIIADIAQGQGLDKDTFINLFESEQMQEKSQEDVYKARSMGANVFPSLVLIDEDGHLCVIKGYRSYKEMRTLLQ